MSTESALLEALREPRFVAGSQGLRFLFDVLNEATADDLGLILPTREIGINGDISSAFAVDFGSPSHKRRVLKERVRRAIKTNRGDQLRAEWMRRLAVKATKAMRAGQQMPARR
jgi:hypothetical protein